jgi:hypothetical protein
VRLYDRLSTVAECQDYEIQFSFICWSLCYDRFRRTVVIKVTYNALADQQWDFRKVPYLSHTVQCRSVQIGLSVIKVKVKQYITDLERP